MHRTDAAHAPRGFRGRALDGSVEFGETAEAAVIREFKEELGINVTLTGAPFFMENIYHHEGVLGHELMAVFEVTFPEGAFESVDQITFYEDNGVACQAAWFDLETVDHPGTPALHPTGLMTHLRRAARA